MTIPEADTSPAGHLNELRASLRALAMPASTVPALFPEFAVRPDDLASSFEHWASVVRGDDQRPLSPAQADCLAAVERKLSTMSRDRADFDADLWTETALGSSPHWDEVRRLALAALDALGDDDG
jgi:hypothetical protein